MRITVSAWRSSRSMLHMRVSNDGLRLNASTPQLLVRHVRHSPLSHCRPQPAVHSTLTGDTWLLLFPSGPQDAQTCNSIRQLSNAAQRAEPADAL